MARPAPLAEPVAIAVAIEADGWGAAVPDVAVIVETAARAALAAAYTGPAAELSIVLADDAAVQILNRDYRGQDKPTNVLSFPLGDDEAEAAAQGRTLMLGDIILGYETVAREALAQQKTTSDHLSHLMVHGVLHILGYDHLDEREALAMEALETGILADLGIADPYGGES